MALEAMIIAKNYYNFTVVFYNSLCLQHDKNS